MSEQHLAAHMREYYVQQELSPAAVERLAALAETNWTRTSSRWVRLTRRGGIAAAVLFAAAAAVLLGRMVGRGRAGPGQEFVTAAIAREVAMNHNKHLAPEFVAEDFASLSAQMDKLDFALTEPDVLRGSLWGVTGARYCTVQGRLAAQVQLSDLFGATLTLYEAPLHAEMDAVREGAVEIDGLRVLVWREAGLLMVLAGDAP